MKSHPKSQNLGVTSRTRMKLRGRAGNRIGIPVMHNNSVAYLYPLLRGYCDRAEIVSIIHFPLDFPYCNAARATFGISFETSHPDLKSGRSETEPH